MTLAHNPRIVTDGLVFAYDMGNDKKSWKGAPTTNYLNGSTSGTYPDAFQVVSYAGDGARSEVGTSKFGTNIIQWTATGSTYIYTRDQILDDDLATLSGQTVTFSLYIRRLEGSATGRIRVYDNISGYSYQSVSVTSDFQRVEMTKTLGANPTRIFVMLDNTGGGTYQFHSPQLEISSFATPFTYSSRSTTEALIDWTGNNTITANSLTYNADGSFSFNGSSNYLQISQPNISTSPNRWTITGWINPVASGHIVVPNSNGIDNILSYSTSNGGELVLTVCEIADVNGRSFRTGTSTIPLNQWTHFSVSIDNLSITMYTNGILRYSSTQTISMSNWTGIWRVGQRGNGTNYLNGSIENLQVYNRALTAAEVAQNFNALRGRYGL